MPSCGLLGLETEDDSDLLPIAALAAAGNTTNCTETTASSTSSAVNFTVSTSEVSGSFNIGYVRLTVTAGQTLRVASGGTLLLNGGETFQFYNEMVTCSNVSNAGSANEIPTDTISAETSNNFERTYTFATAGTYFLSIILRTGLQTTDVQVVLQ